MRRAWLAGARRATETDLALAYGWDPFTIGRLTLTKAMDWRDRAASSGRL